MAGTPNYTDYHPRWLRRRVSTYWWLGSWSYFAFVLREMSCLFVAWFVVYLLMLVRAVQQGEANYQQFLSWSATPAILWLNVVSFLFLVYHAYTFFDAAPRAMVVHLGGLFDKRSDAPGLTCNYGIHFGANNNLFVTTSNHFEWMDGTQPAKPSRKLGQNFYVGTTNLIRTGGDSNTFFVTNP